jgi:hypothetical protein
MDIVIKVKMYRQDREGEKEEVSQAFYGEPRLILRVEEFEEAYSESVKKIWSDFDAWMSNGSGWILERVENLYLNTAAYEPMNGSSYLPTPQALTGKKAIINPQNKDNECFKWALLAALHPAKQDAERVSKYEEFKDELDFTGIPFPVILDDIPKIERLNNLAISVYTILEDGNQVYPLVYTKRRDMDPINVLLIEGDEKYHYAWIKNYDRLLSYDNHHGKVFCPHCCYGFDKRGNGKENLRKHKVICEAYGPQRTTLPKEGENWIHFEEVTKMMKLPYPLQSMLTLRQSMSSCKGVNPAKTLTWRKRPTMKLVVSILLLFLLTSLHKGKVTEVQMPEKSSYRKL